MKHKILKMHWATWRNLRMLIPGLPGETMDDYMRRVIIELKKEDVERGYYFNI
jgi:radical SAM superfamily enzyme YgiQ (UPF0313 family)